MKKQDLKETVILHQVLYSDDCLSFKIKYIKGTIPKTMAALKKTPNKKNNCL